MEEVLWGSVPFVLGVAALIVGIRMKKAARAIDLPNELRVTLRPVLRQLSQDLHPEEKIKVSMNLSGLDEKKCTGTKNLPPGRNRSLTQSAYDEDLGSIRMPLIDKMKPDLAASRKAGQPNADGHAAATLVPSDQAPGISIHSVAVSEDA